MLNAKDNADANLEPLLVAAHGSPAIGALRLAPALHSLAEALMLQIYTAGSVEQLNWAHGRADGFALGLDTVQAVTRLQSDYLAASYRAAREWREDRIRTP